MVDGTKESSAINWENVVQGAKTGKTKDIDNLKENKEEESGDIIYAAQRVLGDYLVDGNFPWKNQISGNVPVTSFLRTFGPYALRIGRDNYNSVYKVEYETIKRDILEKILERMAGGYYEKTDLKVPANVKLEYKDFFPELAAINRLVVNSNSFENIDSPLGIVMMMSNEKRPLMAVACKKLSDEQKIKILGCNDLKTSLPYVEAVIETAKEYNITKIRDVITEFNAYSMNVVR